MILISIQISKKLVNSDYKNNRVEDPTRITSRKEKQVKLHVKEYFDKAAAKRRDHERRKAEQKEKGGEVSKLSQEGDHDMKKEDDSDGEAGIDITDDEIEKDRQRSDTPGTPRHQLVNGDLLKRKRDGSSGLKDEDPDATPNKRFKSETPPPPPPPPPPPSNEKEVLEESTLSDMLLEESGNADNYQDSPEASCNAHGHYHLGNNPRSQSNSPLMEIDLASPPLSTFGSRAREISKHTDQQPKNMRQSPLIFGTALSVVEGERVGVDQERGYAGMEFEHVQRLQVRNGV